MIAKIPEVIATIKWSIFLISTIIKEIKVKGTANAKFNSFGMTSPKTIPAIVESCQINHNVNPDPNKW